ncbi:hypothetical protein JFV29_13290 [Peribacillus sp. TH16]|uniref:hypothetical protein n=1 Tax=Peribacillus sp. TH16 TaxID=2798482 RepID=UPI0019116253|nr:hypothetical protein [Peribacillus sp. TH16]MBK5482848.1 hypothetical protein [Peribacillus sp. TH16]
MWLPEKVIVKTSLDYVKEQGCKVDDIGGFSIIAIKTIHSFSSFTIHGLSLGVF